VGVALQSGGEPGFFFTALNGTGLGDDPPTGLTVLDGRLATQDADDEIALNEEAARFTGASVGDTIELRSYGRDQMDEFIFGDGKAKDYWELEISPTNVVCDVRMAALARIHLGRVLRALGEPTQARTVLESATAWHRASGGGEQAALGECLLAAMDAVDEIPGAYERLVAILDAARLGGEAHVEVFALDALGGIAAREGDIDTARALCEAADRRMEAASHFITDLDRTDAHEVKHAASR